MPQPTLLGSCLVLGRAKGLLQLGLEHGTCVPSYRSSEGGLVGCLCEGGRPFQPWLRLGDFSSYFGLWPCVPLEYYRAQRCEWRLYSAFRLALRAWLLVELQFVGWAVARCTWRRMRGI